MSERRDLARAGLLLLPVAAMFSLLPATSAGAEVQIRPSGCEVQPSDPWFPSPLVSFQGWRPTDELHCEPVSPGKQPVVISDSRIRAAALR